MNAPALLSDPSALEQSAILTDPVVHGDIDLEPPLVVEPQPASMPVARRVLSGTSALGAGIFLERGAGFLANILAARYAGAQVFGAYSLAISTANNISTYAAGGIGATAARFSGKYPYGSTGYSTLGRVLALVSFTSALVAAGALWFGAGPIAHLLHKESLAGLLRWAAISAAGIILLECARGFFVGQRRIAAILLLSVMVGVGMLSLMPWAASTHQPTRMILAQGAVALLAVAVCLSLSRRLHLLPSQRAAHPASFRRILAEVWGFGLVQLAGLVGANLSGWWLMALVARSDTSLVQMGFFAIASQLRNLVGVAPGLLTEGSYAVMADPAEEHLRTPQRVTAVCGFASTVTSFTLAALGMLVVPWGLLKLYGHTYSGAALTSVMGLSVAVVHMGNAPAAARLSIVSIRAAGLINTAWAAFVAASASVLLLRGGSAALGMGIFFAAHLLSAVLVLLTLRHKQQLPAGTGSLLLLSSAAIGGLALTAFFREQQPQHAGLLSLGMLCIATLAWWGFYRLGKTQAWLPTVAAVRQLRTKLLHALRQRLPGPKRGSLYGS